MTSTDDNRFFARLSTTLSGHEPETLRRLRQKNLAGLSGRVLEVGAGTGTNFEFYPATVDEVVDVEPRAAAGRDGTPGSDHRAGAGHRQHRHGGGFYGG